MTRKARKKPVETYALFIFEITGWEPRYELGINGSRYEDGAYHEVMLLTVQTVCRYPEKLAGRTAHFDLYGQRNFMEPQEWKRDPAWRPRNVAHLELPPSGGRCYARLPHESMAGLTTALAHQRFRYVSLQGPPLSRGSSLSTSIGFSRDEGLDDAHGQATAAPA